MIGNNGTNGTNGTASLGTAFTMISEGRINSPDEWALLAASKIVSISETAPDELRFQATQFKAKIQVVIAQTIARALMSERSEIATSLADEFGMTEAAELVVEGRV